MNENQRNVLYTMLSVVLSVFYVFVLIPYGKEQNLFGYLPYQPTINSQLVFISVISSVFVLYLVYTISRALKITGFRWFAWPLTVINIYVGLSLWLISFTPIFTPLCLTGFYYYLIVACAFFIIGLSLDRKEREAIIDSQKTTEAE